jgi:hypothetical protein
MINKLSQDTEDAKVYAQKIYGNKVQMILNGDVNSNGKPDALALDIKGTINEMKFWIVSGGVVEKDADNWKVILDMKDKIRTPVGELIEQVPAANGYVFGFSMAQSPIVFTISIANTSGTESSYEVLVKWNSEKNNYEISGEEIPQ